MVFDSDRSTRRGMRPITNCNNLRFDERANRALASGTRSFYANQPRNFRPPWSGFARNAGFEQWANASAGPIKRIRETTRARNQTTRTRIHARRTIGSLFCGVLDICQASAAELFCRKRFLWATSRRFARKTRLEFFSRSVARTRIAIDSALISNRWNRARIARIVPWICESFPIRIWLRVVCRM